MKAIIQTSTTENKNGAISIIKGILIAYGITLLLIFIYSFLLTYTNIQENTISPVILIITAISILIGSSIGSNKIKKKGLLNGGIIGFLYIMVLYCLSSFTSKRFFIKFICRINDYFFYFIGDGRWNCRC